MTSGDIDHIKDICRNVNPTHLQIVEEISIKHIEDLKKSFPEMKIVKVIFVKDKSALEEAKKYEKFVDFILLDSRVGSQRGGHRENT